MGGEIYLIATLCIKEDPAKLNYFGRVLGNIHAMLITRCGHMDDHITVEIGFLPLIVCHSNIPTWGISPSTLTALKYSLAALFGICKSWRNCCSVRTSQAGRGLCVALAKGEIQIRLDLNMKRIVSSLTVVLFY